jgi:hypothetical protein
MLNVTLAPPQRHRALTIYPLVTADEAELPYTLLVDAVQAGTLKITEIPALWSRTWPVVAEFTTKIRP